MATQAFIDLAASALSLNDARDREALTLMFDIIGHQGEPGEPGGGEGFQLRDLTPYLKGYRFHQLHPWVLPTVAAVAGAGLLYLLMRRKR